MRVIVDAMGGDNAPLEIVRGALNAAKAFCLWMIEEGNRADIAKYYDSSSQVYKDVQFSGPSYETPAEVRMARAIGGDAVGMSTAVEAIAANHMGMHICGISCITNMAAGVQTAPLNHAEVQETADRVAEIFSRIVTASILAIADAIN